jgi:hypothetical protein
MTPDSFEFRDCDQRMNALEKLLCVKVDTILKNVEFGFKSRDQALVLALEVQTAKMASMNHLTDRYMELRDELKENYVSAAVYQGQVVRYDDWILRQEAITQKLDKALAIIENKASVKALYITTGISLLGLFVSVAGLFVHLAMS